MKRKVKIINSTTWAGLETLLNTFLEDIKDPNPIEIKFIEALGEIAVMVAYYE